MPAAFFSAGLNFLGAQEQASATEAAANTRAAAERESARLAAEAAKFRPVGITTRFGTSNFQFDPQGYLTGAGYNLAPELRGYQDRLMGLTERGLGQAEAGEAMLRPTVGAAQSLFNLGSRYLEQTPEQTAQKYMESQYNLLAPSRERQYAQLQNQLFQTGRGGLSVGGTGLRPSGGMGLSASQPELESYYNAIAQQDAELAARAEQAGQQRTAFGAGLFGTGSDIYNLYSSGQVNALRPFTNYLSSGQAIEGLGQESLRLGSELGGKASTAGANVGDFLFRGGSNAAITQQRGQGFSPEAGLYSAFAESPELRTRIEKLFSGYGQPVETGYTGSMTMSPYENEQLANSFLYDQQQRGSSAYY